MNPSIGRMEDFRRAAHAMASLAFLCLLPMAASGHVMENGALRISFGSADEGYPIYKKLGFADKVQNFKEMRLVVKKG